jgi:signal transduction histidine kinase
VFDPFFTTKEVGRGTGLGLDAARRIIVDRHHGSLTLETQPGRTTFRARVPLDAGTRS